MTNIKRIDWIDLLKGIGILLVVVGHSPRDIIRETYMPIEVLYQFIYTFHMGLFFAISGYLYKNFLNTTQNYCKKKIINLFVPWLTYSFIIYIIMVLCNYIPNINSILMNSSYSLIPIYDYIKDMVIANNPYSFHLWYSYILFIIQIFIYCVDNYLKINTKTKYISIIIISIVFNILFRKIIIINFLTKNILYYILGIQIARCKCNFKGREKIYYFGFLINIVITILIIMLKDKYFLQTQILKYVTILIGTPMIIISLFKIARKINKIQLLNFFGKNSYNIYLLHQPFCCGFVGMILVKILKISFINSISIMIICILLSFIFPIFLLKIVKKMKLEDFTKKILGLKLVN